MLNIFGKKLIGVSVACVLIIVAFSKIQTQATNFDLANSSLIISESNNTTMKNLREREFNQLIASQNQFSIKLFREVFKRSDDAGNIFISPLSVSLALSLLYNGSAGMTQEEIARTLETEIFLNDDATFNQANRMLLNQLNNTKNELELANSLWVGQGLPVNPKFLDINRQSYKADINGINFRKPQSVDIINAWVADRTRGKISKITDQLSPETMLLLINTIYFKGQWESQFDPQLTKNQPFFVSADQVKEHPLMSNFGEYNYFEDESVQAVNLPYQGGKLGMYIFLPEENASLQHWIESLSINQLNDLINKMQPKEGLIELPRFRQTYEVNLNKILQQLGLKKAFDRSQADFSPLSSTPLSIDEVKQKTFIEVNEEGTEAAAVTGIGAVITSVSIPFQMRVDRPFLFIIRDSETGVILFMGSIVDPFE
jgi:serpin B